MMRLFIALAGCSLPAPMTPDAAQQSAVVDTAVDPRETADTAESGETGETDTSETAETGDTGLGVGDFCDPETSGCPEGTGCCVGCCIPDLPPTCQPLDEDGTCPLPDLTVDETALAAYVTITTETFEEDNCAVIEGCVTAPGERKVLRFATITPNLGTADAVLGFPEDRPDLFEWSECHQHYHYDDFAAYTLISEDGTVIPAGRKQAFCLMDAIPPESGGIPVYTCANQGISVGWADAYPASFDCQFIDVTDTAPGTYTLRVTLDPNSTMRDKDETNDSGEITVTIP